ncbi:hypothetical protein GCM10022600_25210 [Qipengyuania pelagi]|uniref:DUF4145 domain-containing protein n=1 Tax=Qipengyuania pelagi TaxID=994320 RepID=A0A844Y3S2_9SPHN|nr:hypothetical protein [Qipengyuania pelagi]MXO52641.1 hypothetical protein [Qipengyuania pelagi]
MIDEAPSYYGMWQEILKKEMSGSYVSVFNFIQFLLDDEDFNRKGAIAQALVDTRAAYRVTDGLLHPVVSDEATATISNASKDMDRLSASGAKSHFRQASVCLTNGDWSGAAHQSVAAVESAARFVCEDEKNTLSDLVKEMAKDGRISHPALREVILKIYGYASDEKGVRHSQGAQSSENVTEREALFLFGLCASTISYLLGAAKAVGPV